MGNARKRDAGGDIEWTCEGGSERCLAMHASNHKDGRVLAQERLGFLSTEGLEQLRGTWSSFHCKRKRRDALHLLRLLVLCEDYHSQMEKLACFLVFEFKLAWMTNR